MTINAATRSVRTLLFTRRMLEAQLNITPNYEVDYTINTKRNVFPAVKPTGNEVPKLHCFGIGVNGHRNIAGNTSEPREVKPEFLDLYDPIPFRIRALDQDLSPTDRAKYRMRAILPVGNTSYIAYYLKKVTLEATSVGFNNTTTNTSYSLNSANLTPTPPAPQEQGQVQGSGSTIEASLSGRLIVTGAEIAEVAAVLYGGNASRIRVSEIGIYSGVDKNQTVSYNQANITYAESIFTELCITRTWGGVDLASLTSSIDETINFSSESLGIA